MDTGGGDTGRHNRKWRHTDTSQNHDHWADQAQLSIGVRFLRDNRSKVSADLDICPWLKIAGVSQWERAIMATNPCCAATINAQIKALDVVYNIWNNAVVYSVYSL